jgi:lysophospholipase L1-like esterase
MNRRVLAGLQAAFSFALACVLMGRAAFAAEPATAESVVKPATLMTTPGKLLLAEDFAAPLPPPVGSVARFASGFQGWRFNVEQRGGHWDIVDGTFRGTENAAHKHPATASIGFEFQNVVIACQVRLHDVPLDGRKSRGFSIRTTDTKDYVCSVLLNPNGMRIQKDDNDHAGPDTAVPLGQLKTPIALGEWQTVVFEILGDEMVGTLNGRSLTGRHPLITSAKKSIMFVSSGEGSVRRLRVWEALPNPQWKANKQTIAQNMPPLRIALIGDSTAASYPKPPADRPTLTGWGQVFGQYFGQSVEIKNHAASGRSSKSFLREGRWEKVLAEKPDYVFIQFGHNDQPGKGDRSTDPDGDFQDNLRKYIDDARAIGAVPVLVTPVARRTFENGHAHTTLRPYADAMHRVAKEKNVALVDLHAASFRLYDERGDEATAHFSPSPGDRTHFSRQGAIEIAGLVASALPQAVPALQPYLRQP